MSRQSRGGRAFIWIHTILLACVGCGGSGGSSSTPTPAPSSNNVLAASINPSSAVCDFINSLCASVTICQPNTPNCQTISDIVVDTGAQGLRIFSSAITVPLTPATSGGQPIGECAFFGSLTSWGSVQIASVVLGGEPAVQVPIQVINPTFAGQYAANGSPVQGGNRCAVGVVESTPANSGFNGLLGVGLFKNDGQSYYSCNGTTCTPVALPAAQQVQNPIALLPVDNNGVVVQLPAVGSSGAFAITGSLILGIGTQSNNQPSGVTVYPANNCGRFITTYKGTTFQSAPNCTGGAFLDTGSNALFFQDATIPSCSGGLSDFYCPASTLSLTATTTGASGSPSGTVNFQVAPTNVLLSTGNTVFNNLAGPVTGFFDWGIPFFLGRTVFVGISGQNSVLGTGPFYAY